MSTLLAVDPGIRGCGAALFKDGVLVDAEYVASPCLEGNRANEARSMAERVARRFDHAHVSRLAVEWPRIYASRIRAGETKEDPNDLLALAAVSASIAALFPYAPATSYVPSEWKAQMPKEVCQDFIRRRLSKAEGWVMDKVEKAARSKAHNVWDAVGIGMFHLGRMERKRVIPE